jgi:hypothetical protein
MSLSDGQVLTTTSAGVTSWQNPIGGSTGFQGATGFIGATGFTGSTGFIGATGVTTTVTGLSLNAQGAIVLSQSGNPTTLTTTGKAWLIGGNTGVGSTGFIGTVNTDDFIIKTGGSANTNERMRVMGGVTGFAGQIVMNRVSPVSDDVFSVFGNGATGFISVRGNVAIHGYVNNAIGIGVFGQSDNLVGGIGVKGTTSSGAGFGVLGTSTATIGGAGVRGETSTPNGYGVQGISRGATGFSYGVYGQNASNNGASIYAYNISTVAPSAGTVGAAISSQNDYINTSGSAVSLAILGLADGISTVTSLSTSNHNGCGVYGGSKNIGIIGNSQGSGDNCWGGLFSNTQGGASGFLRAYAYVGGQGQLGTNGSSIAYKILGLGTVSTIVKDVNNNERIMYAPEGPECLFEDHGIGQLTNGFCQITLDPVFSYNIIVCVGDPNHIRDHPLRVYIQLEDDCNGVFVTNKTQIGFNVQERLGGTSNAKFSYRVTGNRRTCPLGPYCCLRLEPHGDSNSVASEASLPGSYRDMR